MDVFAFVLKTNFQFYYLYIFWSRLHFERILQSPIQFERMKFHRQQILLAFKSTQWPFVTWGASAKQANHRSLSSTEILKYACYRLNQSGDCSLVRRMKRKILRSNGRHSFSSAIKIENNNNNWARQNTFRLKKFDWFHFWSSHWQLISSIRNGRLPKNKTQ